jgi:hypothetical protein
MIGGEANFEERGGIREPALAVAKIEITAINYLLGTSVGRKAATSAIANVAFSGIR